MGGDRAGVAAHDRAGERAVAVAQGVVQGRGQQRRQDALGGLDAGAGEQVGGLAHERDQVVRPVRQRRVVQRADGLGDAHRLGAHLDDQRLADEPGGLRVLPGPSGAVTPTQAPVRRATSSARPVIVIAGCRAIGSTSCSAAGASTPTPAAPQVWTTIWPGRRQSDAARPADQAGQHVVGHREQREVGAAHDLVGREDLGAGQELLGAGARRARDRGGGDDRVAGVRERGAQHRADPPGGDDADREPASPHEESGSRPSTDRRSPAPTARRPRRRRCPRATSLVRLVPVPPARVPDDHWRPR